MTARQQGRRFRRALVPRLLRLATPLPLSVAEWTMALASIGQACARPERIQRALSWARAHEHRAPRRWRLALSLLAWRGRWWVRPMMAFMDVEECRRRLRLEGVEHLEAARSSGGVILLNFHLGPHVSGPILQAAGHTFVTTGMVMQRPAWWPRPRPSWARFAPLEYVLLPPQDAAAQALALSGIRRLLLEGRTVRLAGDGVGREIFRIAVAGAEIAIRGGWWTLRRHTRAKTLPLLSQREGRRLVVTVHPPLPDPVPDPTEDTRLCREALAPVLTRFVASFPEQCTLLAFGGGPSPRHERADEIV